MVFSRWSQLEHLALPTLRNVSACMITLHALIDWQARERRLCLTFSSLLSWQQAHQQQTVYTSQSGRHPRRMLYLRRISFRSVPPLPASHYRSQLGQAQLPGRLQGVASQAGCHELMPPGRQQHNKYFQARPHQLTWKETRAADRSCRQQPETLRAWCKDSGDISCSEGRELASRGTSCSCITLTTAAWPAAACLREVVVVVPIEEAGTTPALQACTHMWFHEPRANLETFSGHWLRVTHEQVAAHTLASSQIRCNSCRGCSATALLRPCCCYFKLQGGAAARAKC